MLYPMCHETASWVPRICNIKIFTRLAPVAATPLPTLATPASLCAPAVPQQSKIPSYATVTNGEGTLVIPGRSIRLRLKK